MKASLPRLKTGQIVPTGPPGWGLGRADNPTRKTTVTKPQQEPRIGRILKRRTRQRQRNNDLRIFSWNVRSLYREEADKQLADTLSQYRADVTALQEMRWTGTGFLEKSHYTIYYSGHPVNHVLGVGFLVSQKMKPAVIGFESISERLCTLRLRGKFRNISLINVHAPTEETAESEKDTFYEAVERALEARAGHLILMDEDDPTRRQTLAKMER